MVACNTLNLIVNEMTWFYKGKKKQSLQLPYLHDSFQAEKKKEMKVVLVALLLQFLSHLTTASFCNIDPPDCPSRRVTKYLCIVNEYVYICKCTILTIRCWSSSMVECEIVALETGVRFSPPALPFEYFTRASGDFDRWV